MELYIGFYPSGFEYASILNKWFLKVRPSSDRYETSHFFKYPNIENDK